MFCFFYLTHLTAIIFFLTVWDPILNMYMFWLVPFHHGVKDGRIFNKLTSSLVIDFLKLLFPNWILNDHRRPQREWLDLIGGCVCVLLVYSLYLWGPICIDAGTFVFVGTYSHARTERVFWNIYCICVSIFVYICLYIYNICTIWVSIYMFVSTYLCLYTVCIQRHIYWRIDIFI